MASQFFVKYIQNEHLKKVMSGKIQLLIKLAGLCNQTRIKEVDFLNSTSDNNMKSLRVGSSTWKNCQARPGNLFYECITSIVALNE